MIFPEIFACLLSSLSINNNLWAHSSSENTLHILIVQKKWTTLNVSCTLLQIIQKPQSIHCRQYYFLLCYYYVRHNFFLFSRRTLLTYDGVLSWFSYPKTFIILATFSGLQVQSARLLKFTWTSWYDFWPTVHGTTSH